jgi:hypothetical protein
MLRKYACRAEICTVFAFGISLILQVSLNGMKPWITPDTAGYLARYPWPVCLSQPRIPLYGWLVSALTFEPGNYSVIPWAQFLLLAISSLVFTNTLRMLGLDATARVATGIAIAFSNLVLIWCRALMPTMPAVSFLLLAISGIVWMAAQKPKSKFGVCILTVLATALAWLLDPGLLTFVFMLPLLFWSLSTGQNTGERLKNSGVIFLACLAPFLLMSSVRAAEVGDFNIVSFGGFQMSGMAALILSPVTVDRIAPSFRPLASAILQERTKLEENGTAIAAPENSRGQRSFPSEAIGYFDILARTHDAVLYGAVAAQRRQGESWVHFNTRLERFSLATLRAQPVDYLAWIAGAVSRLVGHALVMNPVFILPAALSLFLFVAFPSSRVREGERFGMLPMIPIILFYTLGTTLLTVTMTFPAQRYIDVGGLMLAALPIYVVMQQFRRFFQTA